MNTFKLENYELVQAIQNREIPSVLIIVDDYASCTKCTNTLEVQALSSTLGEDFEDVLNIATGAMKAGASVVIAGNLAPQLGNDIRTVIAIGDDAPTKADLLALEADGIFRIVMVATAPTMTGWTESDKSRFVLFDSTTLASTVNEAEVMGYIAGQICVGYFQDSALPYNNIPLPMLNTDDVTYKTQAELNTLFHAGKIAFYNVNGQPCIFGIPTLATYSQTALWFDLTVRQTTDYVADAIIYDLKQKYPRTKRSQETLSSIKATVLGVLDSMASRQIIENVENANCVVMTDPSDVYGIIISYTIDVITPLYVVTIKQSVTLGDNSTVLVG